MSKRGRVKRVKRVPAGSERRGRRMKKALAGPAERAAKKLPERRAMIAAARRLGSRFRALAAKWAKSGARVAAKAGKSAALKAKPRLKQLARVAAPRLRWALAKFLRGLSIGERQARRGASAAGRAIARAAVLARRAAAVVTFERCVAALILAGAACLLVSQFVDYRAVEIGQPGYAGLPAAKAPTVAARTAGEAHSYLLLPLALVAGCLAALALRRGRARIGMPILALGVIAVAVILVVDLPAGLDAGAEASRFAGAHAILLDGFYLELFSALALMVGGLLMACSFKKPKIGIGRHGNRLRKPSLARTQGGRRSARTSSGA